MGDVLLNVLLRVEELEKQVEYTEGLKFWRGNLNSGGWSC